MDPLAIHGVYPGSEKPVPHYSRFAGSTVNTIRGSRTSVISTTRSPPTVFLGRALSRAVVSVVFGVLSASVSDGLHCRPPEIEW